MRLYFSLFLLLFLISCAQDKKSNTGNAKSFVETKDTILVKQQNILNASYEVGFYSKSFSYYWLVGKDTLDFIINVAEYERDSTFHLNIHHRQPMLFTSLLNNINQCLPLIKNDFDITKLRSIYFKSPVYYLDLAKELSSEYEHKFDRKGISFQMLNEFLLNSSLNTRLDRFLNPLNKKVNSYSIEKFHLMDKARYSSYFPDTDLKDYPEFTIEGMGISIQLEDK